MSATAPVISKPLLVPRMGAISAALPENRLGAHPVTEDCVETVVQRRFGSKGQSSAVISSSRSFPVR
jgi:hypothetical protein